MTWNPTGLFINVSNPTEMSAGVVLQCFPTVQWIGYFDKNVNEHQWGFVPTSFISSLNQEHPFPLARAISDFLEQKQYAPGHSLLITDQEKDIIDAAWCHVRVVFVGTSIAQEVLPDAWCSTQALTTWQHHQFLGELRSEDLNSTGGLLVCGLRPSNYVATATLWGAGRYFAKNDSRSAVHLLTKRLLLLKSWQKGKIDPALIKMMRESLPIIEHGSTQFTMMTAIPSKHRSPDRLGTLLRQAFPGDKRVNTSLVRIAGPIEKQSSLGRTARKDNVVGAYHLVASSLVGHRILVVDDIVTTGATLSAVAAQLEQRGAVVTCLALAVDQHLVSENTWQLPCPCRSCDGYMVVKLNRTNFRPFWGCTNYAQGCSKTLDYGSGINGYLQLPSSSAIIKDWDLPF